MSPLGSFITVRSLLRALHTQRDQDHESQGAQHIPGMPEDTEMLLWHQFRQEKLLPQDTAAPPKPWGTPTPAAEIMGETKFSKPTPLCRG